MHCRTNKSYTALVALATAICLFSAAGSVQAATVWNEAVNGDISGDRTNPNSVVFAVGTNSLFATTGTVDGVSDREYFTFTVPVNKQFTGLVPVSYTAPDGISPAPDGTAFIGIQSGTTFTEPPTGTTVANLLGYSHFGSNIGNVGANILPSMGTASGAADFTPPLGTGSYTLWIQQLGSPVAYQLDFTLTPEPSSLGLMVLGAALLLPPALIRIAKARRMH